MAHTGEAKKADPITSEDLKSQVLFHLVFFFFACILFLLTRLLKVQSFFVPALEGKTPPPFEQFSFAFGWTSLTLVRSSMLVSSSGFGLHTIIMGPGCGCFFFCSTAVIAANQGKAQREEVRPTEKSGF